jgi:hypothetical protein
MDARFEQDSPPAQEEPPPARRFAAIAAEQDAVYPMLAPAAAVHLGQDEDAFDDQLLAGLVNI